MCKRRRDSDPEAGTPPLLHFCETVHVDLGSLNRGRPSKSRSLMGTFSHTSIEAFRGAHFKDVRGQDAVSERLQRSLSVNAIHAGVKKLKEEHAQRVNIALGSGPDTI